MITLEEILEAVKFLYDKKEGEYVDSKKVSEKYSSLLHCGAQIDVKSRLRIWMFGRFCATNFQIPS
jgi:hypothetical protein